MDNIFIVHCWIFGFYSTHSRFTQLYPYLINLFFFHNLIQICACFFFKYNSLQEKSLSVANTSCRQKLNIISKIISKLLAYRIKVVLHKLIPLCQSAFILGQWIEENTMLAQEVVNSIRKQKGKGGLMAIKIDMSKVYDRLEWNVLQTVLLQHGFAPQLVNLIMFCVHKVSFQIQLNESPLKTITSHTRFRQ